MIAEALTCGVPVVASRIDGNVGMLGRDYAGYFTPGDDRELAQLLNVFHATRPCLRNCAASARRGQCCSIVYAKRPR